MASCPERRVGEEQREHRAGEHAAMPEAHACSQDGVVLPAGMWFSIRRRYVQPGTIEIMRVLVVEDEPYMAEAIRDGLRLEAIAADIAGDGNAALALLNINAYDLAVLDRDIPGPSGDE